MLKKLRMKKEGFTLVELMIVVAIIGILAAIAIPAFLKYIKSSKAAEATGIMKKMADGSKSYFTSEQKYSNTTDGDQPWHGVPDDNEGYPVPWASYVFPGGDGYTYSSTSAAPTGGSKYMPDAILTSDATATAATNKLNFSVEDPLYFQYIYAATGAGDTAEANLTAIADFNAGSTGMHTVRQEVGVNASTQEVTVGPTILTNEFQ